MKKYINLAAFAVLALVAVLGTAALNTAHADTSNLSVSTPGVVLLPVHLQGQHTADVTAAARIKLPFPAKVLGVSAAARASGGTTPTLTVDVLDDGVSMLSAPIAVTAGAVAEGTVTSTAVGDESVVTVNLAIGGTTPTWDDIDVLVTLVRN
ncbi:MAG: hypothetical protein HQL36_08210 [Alphaproteobacteria bacterium]|nr:hypothetical protein [Alphaproteobacteria bacterium]